MSVDLRSYSNLSSNSLALTFTIAAPAGVADGDLLIFSVALMEFSPGQSALVKNDGGLTTFTDLLTDGVSETGTGKQYVFDPGGGADRHFWWLGYKIASGEPSSYTINVKAGNVFGSFGCQANIFAFEGNDPTTPVGNTVLGTYPEIVFPFTLPSIVDAHGKTIDGKVLAMSSGNNNMGGFCILLAEDTGGAETFYVIGDQINQNPVSRVIAGAGLTDVASISEGVQGEENTFLLAGGTSPLFAAEGGVHMWRRF